MTTIGDISLDALIDILSVLGFFIAFALLRLQPVNDRIYFSKWYLRGLRSDPPQNRPFIKKFVNFDLRSYLRFLEWMPAALRMTEIELINHAGLDSVAYLRIYLMGLKIFSPITLIAVATLIPINWMGDNLIQSQIKFSAIDKISISNVKEGSPWLWAHLSMAYVFSFWTCYILFKEYENVAKMRLDFLASEGRCPDQFTVLVRNVPPDPDEDINELVEHFFLVNHSNQYLFHQVVYDASKLAKIIKEKKEKRNWLIYYQGKYDRHSSKRPEHKIGFCGFFGSRVDAIEYYASEVNRLSEEAAIESEKIKENPKYIIPAAFVSFRSRWGAAVCAQTQQTRDPTLWLTDWAPEPRDIYWENLSVPVYSLTIRRMIIAIAFFFLTFFCMIPISLVQTLANIEVIVKYAPFLKPIIGRKLMKSFVQGFLPGIVLKGFLILLPTILMFMSKVEGSISLSSLERSSASKHYLFLLVNAFLGSVVAGTAFEQLNTFIHQAANQIPVIIGQSIPLKATFFITYIMVDGWVGVSAEIVRVKQLIFFHLKNYFIIKTEKDKEEAMDPGTIDFHTYEPRIQLYFLLGLVYAAVTPFLLPFMLVYFALAYVVFRHQVINVYNQSYESGAAFWPDVHKRMIAALIIAQILLIGLLSTKKASQSTPFLIFLVVMTIYFHKYCKKRFEPAFLRYPLQEAMVKDTLERVREPNLDLKRFLSDAYVHPMFKAAINQADDPNMSEGNSNSAQVLTKRKSKINTPEASIRLSNTSSSAPSIRLSNGSSSTPSGRLSNASSSEPSVRLSNASSSATSVRLSNVSSSAPSFRLSNASSSTPGVKLSNASSSAPSVRLSNASSSAPGARLSNASSSAPSVRLSNMSSSTPSVRLSNASSSTPNVRSSDASSSTPLMREEGQDHAKLVEID